jgi:hypothetical protein
MTAPTDDPRGATVVDPAIHAAGADEGAQEGPPSRRARFRAAIADLSQRSTSQDLVRWMLVPGSFAVLLGFVAMALGWVGAARTAREVEQIPYLISGGLVGLALVFLGGLLLVATFWVVVAAKLHDESAERATTRIAELEARVVALEAAREPAPRPRRNARSGATRHPSGTIS